MRDDDNQPKDEDAEATIFQGGSTSADDHDTARTPIQPLASDSRTGAQESDRFTLRQVLGEGSQGEVCRAFDNHLQREVAIKFPHRSAGDEEAVAILDEARKAARLNHPNAVTVYECGWWQGRPFICMELVPGISLAGLLKECGRVSVDRWARYGRQILGALKAAHAVGLVHRDLKPQNVLVAPSGELKLTDFGIAHVARGPRTRDTSMQNVIAGTPLYMSPEQWNGESPDARSDIYAFGCMSFVMLSGRGPFAGENPMREHLEDPIPSLRDRLPDAPRAVAQVVERCLAKDPNARFNSCDDLLFAIDRALRESATATAEVDAPEPSTKRGAPLALLVALGAFIGVGAFFVLGTDAGRKMVGLETSDPESPDVTPRDEQDPTPVDDDPTPRSGPDPVAERDARVQDLLGRARDTARTAEERRAAITEIQGLITQGPAWDEASRLAAQLRLDGERRTEAQLRKKLDSVIAGVRTQLDAGDLDTARASLEEARALVANQVVLRSRSGELHQLAEPVLAALGDRAAQRGRFEEARGHFAEAARQSALAPGGNAARNYDSLALLAQRLELCNAVIDQQPGFSLDVLERLGRATQDWPAAAVLRAEAEILLGRISRARKHLDALAAEKGLDPVLAARIEALRDLTGSE